MYKIKEIDEICKKFDIKNYIINKDGSIDVCDDVILCFKKIKKLPLNFNVVSGSCNFKHNYLNSLKGSPKYVGGYFNCLVNELTSLKYSPKEIKEEFDCSYNNLKTLEYGPEKVGDGYYCDHNNLISLKGASRIFYNDFNCSYNKLKTLEYGPERVFGNYDCSNNELKNLKGCAKYIKNSLVIENNYHIYSFDGLMYNNIRNINCDNTILYNVWKLFKDVSKIELFNEMDIIRENNECKPIIILDRLNEFLDMIGRPRVKYVEGYINI